MCLQEAIEDKNGILSHSHSSSIEGGNNLMMFMKSTEGRSGGGLIETLLASKRDAMVIAKDELIK